MVEPILAKPLPDKPLLFSLASDHALATAVSQALGLDLAAHEERGFEDGEHKIRPRTSVRGRELFVIASLHADAEHSVNDKLCKLLFFIGSLRDAAAARITAVLPYLCYARKDRQTKSRDPITTRYVAQLFEAVGVDTVVTIDIHNLAAFQNAFRIPTEHLEGMPLFWDYLEGIAGRGPLAVVSPDVGGTKRARRLRDGLWQRLRGRDPAEEAPPPIPLGFTEKERSGGVVRGEAFGGDVAGRTVILFDDLIGSGTTLARAAALCRDRGAKEVIAMATHGLFLGEAETTLAEADLAQIVVTNTVPPFRLSSRFRQERLKVLDTAPFLAEAIRRIHTGQSLVDWLAEPGEER